MVHGGVGLGVDLKSDAWMDGRGWEWKGGKDLRQHPSSFHAKGNLEPDQVQVWSGQQRKVRDSDKLGLHGLNCTGLNCTGLDRWIGRDSSAQRGTRKIYLKYYLALLIGSLEFFSVSLTPTSCVLSCLWWFHVQATDEIEDLLFQYH